MRPLHLWLCAVFLSSAATAQTADKTPRSPSPRIYVEGQIGGAAFGDLDSKKTSGTTTVNGLPVSYSAYQTTFKFDPTLAYGAEVGVRNLFGTRLRMGVAWTTFQQKIRDLAGTGNFTTTGGNYTLGAGSMPAQSTLVAAGVDYENRVNIYTANAYYDFRAVAPYRPFIGLGVGNASFQNWSKNNLAVSGSLGTQINITRNLYAGVKLTGYWIKGPKDGLVEYKPVTLGTAMFTTGVHF